uniref:Ribosomal protein n=1 Tax=Solanum tuberosum TaxID=4113 RepID=M1BRG4_SOLTU
MKVRASVKKMCEFCRTIKRRGRASGRKVHGRPVMTRVKQDTSVTEGIHSLVPGKIEATVTPWWKRGIAAILFKDRQ